MKILVIVDMQEEYMNRFDNHQVLISNIIKKMKSYNQDILYIKNKHKDKGSNIVSDILVNEPKIFIKDKSSAFSSEDFVSYIMENKVTKLEIAGIDGNCCVKNTAIDAINLGINVDIDLSCVGVINNERFKKTLVKLEGVNVNFL